MTTGIRKVIKVSLASNEVIGHFEKTAHL